MIWSDRNVDLGNFIEAKSFNTKVTISNLLPRTDDPSLSSKAKQRVHSILRTFANQNDWKIISHPNITGEHLSSSGLHLNLSGSEAFASDFVRYVKNIWIPNELLCLPREPLLMINGVNNNNNNNNNNNLKFITRLFHANMIKSAWQHGNVKGK